MGRPRRIRYAVSRRKRNVWLVFFIFVMPAAVGTIDHRLGGPLRSVIERSCFYSPDQRRFHLKTFPVAEVIDGDTLDIRMSDNQLVRVRMLGIDTPETKHPTIGVMYYGPEASEYVKNLIGTRPILLRLDTVGDQRDLYGRLLAYVCLEDGRIVNEEIIKNGFGYADLRFEHSQIGLYETLMDEAQQNKAGLWENVRREQLPQWLQDKRPLLLR